MTTRRALAGTRSLPRPQRLRGIDHGYAKPRQDPAFRSCVPARPRFFHNPFVPLWFDVEWIFCACASDVSRDIVTTVQFLAGEVCSLSNGLFSGDDDVEINEQFPFPLSSRRASR